MKSKYLKLIAYICYFLSFVIFGYYIYQELISYFSVPTIFKLIYIFGSSIYIFFGSLILSKFYKTKKIKIKRVTLISLFIEYLTLLLILTLFDPSFGRGFSNVFNSSKEYIFEHINLIPFKTIIGYIKYNNIKFIIINIIGNLVAFMPMGLFMPLIFNKINNVFKFVLSVGLFVIIIEVLQLILLTGSLDIDDLILNVSGALIVYYLFRYFKDRRSNGKI